MPLVSAGMIAALVERWRGSSAPLVRSDYGGVAAPPTLYDRALFAELDAPGDRPGRGVVARHRGQALSVAFPAEALADVDTPEDLARLGARPRSRP
jgi:molybdenum cofactor cytidylyltransferase